MRALKVPNCLSVPFSADALKANLERLRDEWEAYHSTRERDAVYRYLAAVFDLVMWWTREGRAVEYARRALWPCAHRPVPKKPEPFAAVILCTGDHERVDEKTKSKWSRVLRYAAEYKRVDESLVDFVKRKGGINKCAAKYARRLGRGALTVD